MQNEWNESGQRIYMYDPDRVHSGEPKTWTQYNVPSDFCKLSISMNMAENRAEWEMVVE